MPLGELLHMIPIVKLFHNGLFRNVVLLDTCQV